MNARHLEEEQLYRYFDGELSSVRAIEVASHLATCPGCAARHASLRALRQAICESAQDSADAVDFDALFGRIERGIRKGADSSLTARVSVWGRAQLKHGG